VLTVSPQTVNSNTEISFTNRVQQMELPEFTWEEVSQAFAAMVNRRSSLLLTVCRFNVPVDRRHGSETTLSTRRRPSFPSTLEDRGPTGHQNPQTQEKRQDWKALRMLSAILLAFIMTWTPYNLFTVIQTFCTTCINPSLYAVGKSFRARRLWISRI